MSTGLRSVKTNPSAQTFNFSQIQIVCSRLSVLTSTKSLMIHPPDRPGKLDLSVLRMCALCKTVQEMKTLVIRIPDELEAQLEVLASRRGKTKSAIARDVLSRGVRRRSDDLSVFDLMRTRSKSLRPAWSDLASYLKHLEGFGR